jgi:hypothetical protein
LAKLQDLQQRTAQKGGFVMVRELDGVELGQRAAGSLLCEQAPCDLRREQHVKAFGAIALSIAWARALTAGDIGTALALEKAAVT